MTDPSAAAGNAPQRRAPETPVWLRPILAGIDTLGQAGGAIAAIALALLTTLILLEISVRLLSKFIPALPAGMPHAWEYSAYLMGIGFMAGTAMTLRAGAHIRVTVLTSQVPQHARRAFEIAASLVGLLLSAFLAYSLVIFTWLSYTREQTSIASDTPIWIPEAAITLGAILLAMQMLARLLCALWGLPTEEPSLKATVTDV